MYRKLIMSTYFRCGGSCGALRSRVFGALSHPAGPIEPAGKEGKKAEYMISYKNCIQLCFIFARLRKHPTMRMCYEYLLYLPHLHIAFLHLVLRCLSAVE